MLFSAYWFHYISYKEKKKGWILISYVVCIIRNHSNGVVTSCYIVILHVSTLNRYIANDGSLLNKEKLTAESSGQILFKL